jgi:alkylation response protein AidB-like acyl-CoA dehydrogenase
MGAAATFEAWLRATLPAAWVDAVDRGDGPALEAIATGETGDEAMRAAAAAGWLTPDWPERYGGRGLDASEAGEVKALLRRWHVGDVRIAIGTAWVGPTILQWGTEEQRATWLPPIARAEELWCQLFSEPEAGSDLAGLRTAARRDGDTWIVTGTKLWTSRANISRRGLLITRSDSSVPKHQGLTAFGLDMASPGVTVRPIRQMTGDAEFFEVVLDDVRVPDAARIGPPGAGWDVCRTALSFERIAGSGVGAAPPGSVVGRSIEELVAHHRARGGLDRARADRLVRVWIEAELIRLLNRRVAARRAAGQPVGPEGSVTKVLQASHTKALQRLFVVLDGPGGVAWDDGDPWAAANEWAFLRVQAKTIAGGTSEVLRNQLAERVLGLPRDEDPTRALPWEEALRVTGQV